METPSLDSGDSKEQAIVASAIPQETVCAQCTLINKIDDLNCVDCGKTLPRELSKKNSKVARACFVDCADSNDLLTKDIVSMKRMLSQCKSLDETKQFISKCCKMKTKANVLRWFEKTFGCKDLPATSVKMKKVVDCRDCHKNQSAQSHRSRFWLLLQLRDQSCCMQQ